MTGLSPGFWGGRRVLLTGHSGFKGAWAARWLWRLGAEVTGLSLPPPTSPSLHDLLATPMAHQRWLDITDLAALRRAVAEARPSIVLHMAAQSLVPESYRSPVATFASNVMGTVHLLEAMRGADGIDAAIFVTTDKVYANDDRGRPFREGDTLGGDDPYSASKAAAEIATAAWLKSFEDKVPAVGTARAGNVIGGGDWAAGRLIPDIVRAAAARQPVVLRRPDATRPWQHVLDPLHGYLLYAETIAAGRNVPASLNFGPDGGPPVRVRDIAETLADALGAPGWRHEPAPAIGEKTELALDAELARATLGWRPRLNTGAAIAATAAWYKVWASGGDVCAFTDRQIADFEAPS